MMRIGWLPRRTALAIIVAVVVAYTLLAEAQPPVVRAAVLAVLFASPPGRAVAAWRSIRSPAPR